MQSCKIFNIVQYISIFTMIKEKIKIKTNRTQERKEREKVF
jgi:hypothetical protein